MLNQISDKNIVFVFGSNLAGRHGKGAALHAKSAWGAIQGRGIGRQGRSYAIPTKDEKFQPLPIERIGQFVEDFLLYAAEHPANIFLLTPVGCGLSGYPKTIMARVIGAFPIPDNVMLHNSWLKPASEYDI